MNILFLTLLKIETLESRGIYHDLLRVFAAHNHKLYIVTPRERRENSPSRFHAEDNVHFLNLRTLNVQKTNIVEKGFATLSIEHIFLRGVKKYFNDVKFDLVIYSTPPITFTKVINYIKKKDGAKSYLLLKDIFPQNAVDMSMMLKNGLIYKFFRNKERKLYEVSDAIGCMSEANKQYIYDHNPTVNRNKVEVNPNSIEPIAYLQPSYEQKNEVKSKYKLPLDKKIFIYGGNLGIPQGLDFLLETICSNKENNEVFFLVVGNGTEYNRVYNWFQNNKPTNAKLISGLPKEEYDNLIKACDVGMIFLNKNFTIPNFPSRLLSYLEFKMPILVAADPCTDIGREVENHNCGKSVLAGNIDEMKNALNYFCSLEDGKFQELRENSRKYLDENFLVSDSYKKIMNKFF